jgi:uncharacterized protein YabN with tetrapyrrole methylase and pyrophosphatase domain
MCSKEDQRLSLVRRHPHVFGDVTAGTDSEAVLKNWDAIKNRIKPLRVRAKRYLSTQFSAACRRAHALRWLFAMEISKSGQSWHSEWPDVLAVWTSCARKHANVQSELESGADKPRVSEALGDLLFTVVQRGALAKIDPGLALRDTVSRFTRALSRWKHVARGTTEYFDRFHPRVGRLWNAAKAEEMANAQSNKKQQA